MPFFVVPFLFFATFALAVEQEQPTPYDLIRPVYPMVWDTIATDEGGTVESFSSFLPNPRKRNPVPKVGSIPQSFEPNAFIPDTLNQAYHDALDMRISRIRINQAGYLLDDPEKQFYYVSGGSCAETFSVVDLDGNEIAGGGTFTSTGQTTQSSLTITAATDAATNNKNRYTVGKNGPSGTVCVGYLSQLAGLPTEQRMRVKVGKQYSSTFIISNRVYSMVRDAVIKFYGINRSGNSESWFHAPSHTKDGAGPVVDNIGSGSVAGITVKEGELQGGWYDCGDHLKESYTQAYAFMVLAVMAASNPSRDDDNYAYNHAQTVNTDGVPDILREAKHGADYFLRSFRVAKGVVDNMAVSIGNFGADHGWWGRPENQDALPPTLTGRGGPHERDVRVGELGANVSAEIAAGLSILGRDYATYDKAFADSCKMAAKALYDFAKALALGRSNNTHNKIPGAWGTPAYNGGNSFYDDLSVAAIAMHYGTYPDSGMKYLDDAVEDAVLGAGKVSEGVFRGGWFASSRDNRKENNTDWASVQTYALYGFYKMLLKDDSTAAAFGIGKEDRLWYAENVAYTMASNVAARSETGGNSVTIPSWSDGTRNVTASPLWYQMQTQSTWIYNRYQAGNIFDVFAYADVTKDLEGVKLPQKGQQFWNSDKIKQLGINQLNYMLGVNPWDLSFLMGVGDKNHHHPHHRASNPEGKNMPGAGYKYKPPVGAVFGAVNPNTEPNWNPGGDGANATGLIFNPDGARSWENYFHSETCIDGTAMFLAASAVAVKEEDLNRAPSQINVEIRYVGYDSAIVKISQDVRGPAMILYSTNETGPFNVVVKDSLPAVEHEIHMKELKNGTTYFFKVVAINARSEAYTTRWLVDSTSTPYSFTTLLSPPGDADIQNVKVCNLTSDSAEIMWYTPNGQYESKVYWDTVLTSKDQMTCPTTPNGNCDIVGNADVSGIPTSFHYVKIGKLKEKTTYYYCVESNGISRCVDDNGAPLKFTTPVTAYDFSVLAYQYEFTGMDFLNVNIINNEDRAFDSLTLRLYVTARPEDINPVPGENNQPGSCPLLIDEDICQAYDEAGFNKPCVDAQGNSADEMIRYNLRHSVPVRLDDTYDAATGTYGWYFPIPLGGTQIKSSSRMRIDFGFSSGLYQNGGCETLRTAAKKRMTATSGDWSWASHERAVDGADYEGMPILDKDFGDGDYAPVNPYIVIYRKDEFISGFSPSYQEMTTKRAHYEITVTFDKPFDVSNGSYIQLDSSTSTMHLRGNAFITESGHVNSIWVNGVALSPEQLETAAVYDVSSGLYMLDIPVKMSIGTNKVDVTVFAGPDPKCSECQENGGCAFVNRTYYVQFSKGDRTLGQIQLVREDGSSVSSPVTDNPMKFKIVVSDKDNRAHGTVSVMLKNSRTKDSVSVTLKRTDEVLGYFESDWLSAIASASTTLPNVSLLGGDTITVIYIDAEDEEDSTSQYFYAKPTTPSPQTVLLLDANCNSKADQMSIKFTGSEFDGNKVKLDSVLVVMDSTTGGEASFIVKPTGVITGSEAMLVLDESVVPETTAPSGKVTIFMSESGVVKTAEKQISDGIAPKLTSVAILENENHANVQDTLKLVFSEPVDLSSKTVWPLRIVDNGAEIDQSSIQVINASSADNGKSWQYVIEGNDGNIVKPGFKAEIVAGFDVKDMAANLLSDCNGPVTIIESVRPVPVKYAYIGDDEGDGQPDMIYIEFMRTLRTKDIFDTIDVYWGDPEIYKAFAMPASGWRMDTVPGDTTTKIKTQLNPAKDRVITRTSETCGTKDVMDTSWITTDSLDADGNPVKVIGSISQRTVTDRSNCVTKIDSTIIPGLDTLGTETVVNNVTVIRIPITAGLFENKTSGTKNGNGTILPRKGPLGGFFDDNTATLFDKCPPIILEAKIDTIGVFSRLTVITSEPLVEVPGGLNLVERKRGSEAQVYLDSTITKRITDARQSYTYNADIANAVQLGDSVKLVTYQKLGRLKDVAGNYPLDGNPWRIVSGDAGKTKFEVTLYKGVTRATGDVGTYGQFMPGSDEYFRLSVNKAGIETILDLQDGELKALKSTVGADYSKSGPAFKVDITLPTVNIRDTIAGDFRYDVDVRFSMDVFDNMGQFINTQTVNIGSSFVRELISEDGVMHLNLEWLNHDGEAPKSKAGKKIATGAYIAKFKFKAWEKNRKTQESTSTSDDTTKTFGFKRAKQK